jgi:hypothetical protein
VDTHVAPDAQIGVGDAVVFEHQRRQARVSMQARQFPHIPHCRQR